MITVRRWTIMVPNPKSPYKIHTKADTGSCRGAERHSDRYLAKQYIKIHRNKDSNNNTNMMSSAMVYWLVLNSHFDVKYDSSWKHAKTMALKVVTRRIDVICPSFCSVCSSLFPAVKISDIVLKTSDILSNPLYSIVRKSNSALGIKYSDKALQPSVTFLQLLAILTHFKGGRALISFYCLIKLS